MQSKLLLYALAAVIKNGEKCTNHVGSEYRPSTLSTFSTSRVFPSTSGILCGVFRVLKKSTSLGTVANVAAHPSLLSCTADSNLQNGCVVLRMSATTLLIVFRRHLQIIFGTTVEFGILTIPMID